MNDESNLEVIYQFIQEVIRSIPVILLGSGASCACGIPGMVKLGGFLNDNISTNETFREDWSRVYALLDEGLENALQKSGANDNLINFITGITAEYIRKEDCKLFKKLILNEIYLPLSSIIDYIFSGHVQKINIITTNYDRIVEYACDMARIPYTTGFTGGYYKEFSLDKSYELYQRVIKRKVTRTRFQAFNDNVPHVKLFKLHGSIDWFTCDGKIISINNSFEEVKPLIVAPGLRKYLDTYHNPYREIISAADYAILQGNTFLIIGYGFNDQHLQELLIPKIKDPHIKVVVLTKELTKNANSILLGTKNTLVITEKYNGNGTYCYLNGRSFEFGKNFWALREFVSIFTGGDELNEHIS